MERKDDTARDEGWEVVDEGDVLLTRRSRSGASDKLTNQGAPEELRCSVQGSWSHSVLAMRNRGNWRGLET